VPSPELIDSFRRARAAFERSVSELEPLVIEIAVERVADVLPGASELALRGEIDEDSIRILRIQRVPDSGGHVLYDAEVGHDDEFEQDRQSERRVPRSAPRLDQR
jgi:hypothetical protein